jgi:hypothetical protein
VTIGTSGVGTGDDPHVAMATTNSAGKAFASARRVAGVATPDTAIVEAVAITSKGVVVGSPPARFIVLFVNN